MDIRFKKAQKKDCDLLFKWANDPVVRKNSFNSEYIKYENHKKWFKNKLNSENSVIYIAILKEKKVGQIRIDIEGDKGYLDYSIAKKFRGNGYGRQLLVKIIYFIKNNNEINIKKLIGKVKYDNIASKKSFEKAEYKKVKKEKCIKYYKKI